MADAENTIDGDVNGNAVMARDVHGDVNVTYGKRSPLVLRAAAFGAVLLLASLALATHLGTATRQPSAAAQSQASTTAPSSCPRTCRRSPPRWSSI